MTEDEDPFDDLGDDLGKEVDPANDVDLSEPDDEPMSESSDRTTEPDTDSQPLTDSPPFSFQESDQRPLYARTESWQSFEDTLDLDVQRELRESDVRDVPKRELHDAALRVLAEHPEEIAEAVIEGRRGDNEQ